MTLRVVCVLSVFALSSAERLIGSAFKLPVSEVTNHENSNVAFMEPKPPAVLKVRLHESTVLVCQAASQNGPAPLITWLKNGKPMQRKNNNERVGEPTQAEVVVVASTTRSTLHLDCLTMAEATSNYTCLADNTVTRVQTVTQLVLLPGTEGWRHDLARSGCPFVRNRRERKQILAVVVRHPRIVMWSPSSLQLQGQAARLLCRTTGSPPPKVTWQLHYGELNKTGQIALITDDARHTISRNGDLVMRDLDFYEDMGVYVCTAENAFGIAHAEAFLYPLEPTSS
ncbi:hypothetical protein BV898_07253 [Hypsibius exemplaris]|uniref:Ig-like domain-containing protein n=1 Tax=Hypsibius exemplaris TaxID=2072580 RepID=A0A1W0WTU5_HYPEX|nr:hypothetical protein BV898_07253 [Hypsibius exemplaris]